MSEAPERIFVTSNLIAYEEEFRPLRSTEYVRADRIEELETQIKNFFILLDKTEETDEGRVFHPNRISSCRAEDGQKIGNILKLMKAMVEGYW